MGGLSMTDEQLITSIQIRIDTLHIHAGLYAEIKSAVGAIADARYEVWNNSPTNESLRAVQTAFNIRDDYARLCAENECDIALYQATLDRVLSAK